MELGRQLGEAGGRRPILLRSASEDVYTALREDIISGVLRPGDRLTEVVICRDFGLSTTPVREALHQLVHRGLAVKQAARGVRVRHLTEPDIQHIYELRIQLEPAALRQSVPELDRRQVAAIGRLLDEARQALEHGDLVKLSALNDSFHSAILVGAPNLLMLQYIETLGDQRRLIAIRDWSERAKVGNELEVRLHLDLAEHRAILQQIDARDADGAASLLLNHLLTTSCPSLLGGLMPPPQNFELGGRNATLNRVNRGGK